MKKIFFWMTGLGVILFVSACDTVPPGVERGPHGTVAYEVLIEASEPGARIEANHEPIGNAPLRLKIFGDKDGTFHDFGSFEYIIQAFPIASNQFPQTRVFGTGKAFTHEDRIPAKIFFDMNRPEPIYPGSYGPGYGPRYYDRGPDVYFGPPVYFGGRINIGPHGRRHW